MSRSFLLMLLMSLLVLTAAAQDLAQIPASGETEVSLRNGATDPAVWLHPEDPALSLIFGADDEAGMLVYDLAGVTLQTITDEGGVNGIDLRYNFQLNDNETTLVAAGIADEPTVVLYTISVQNRTLEKLTSIETGLSVAAMCMYRSAFTNAYYVFVLSEEGDLEQYRLEDDGDGQIQATLARELSVGGEVEACAVDDDLGALYIAEGEVAVWRYGAEPEAGTNRVTVDVVGGNITDEVEGLAVYYGGDQGGYLIVVNEKNDSFLLYERRAGNAFVGEFRVSETETIDAVTEPTGIEVLNLSLGDAYPEGLFITSDDANSTDGQRVDNNFKLVSWGEIAAALDLTVDTEFRPGQRSSAAAAAPARVETAPVPSGTDAADDPAVWVHPTDTNLSTIIGTDKTAGLVVYNLDGSILQELNIGEVNNVDLRYNFPLGDERVAIVGTTNRSTNTLDLYKVNPETRELELAGTPVPSGVAEVYGFCMYYSMATGNYYAIVNGTEGAIEQYLLTDDGTGMVQAQVVRTWALNNQTEGCVGDDELGFLYIGEEATGIYKYAAEPDAPTDVLLTVDVTGREGNLAADVEGLTIYYAGVGTGAGYLIASSQGNSTYVVYDRAGDNAYLGTFVVIEGGAVDAASGTDGIDVINFPLGDAFPQGAFIVQDDLNINPSENQNFKLVGWEDIAGALGLTIDLSFDPRTVGAQ